MKSSSSSGSADTLDFRFSIEKVVVNALAVDLTSTRSQETTSFRLKQRVQSCPTLLTSRVREIELAVVLQKLMKTEKLIFRLRTSEMIVKCVSSTCGAAREINIKYEVKVLPCIENLSRDVNITPRNEDENPLFINDTSLSMTSDLMFPQRASKGLRVALAFRTATPFRLCDRAHVPCVVGMFPRLQERISLSH